MPTQQLVQSVQPLAGGQHLQALSEGSEHRGPAAPDGVLTDAHELQQAVSRGPVQLIEEKECQFRHKPTRSELWPSNLR